MIGLKKYREYSPLVAVGLVALVLAERLFLLVDRYAVNIFFSDQWEFNDATLFQTHSWWQIFMWQHGPHRQGLGGVLAKLIDPLFQWDSRRESFFVAGIFVAAMLLALWLKRRLFGRIDLYDVAVPTLLLTATQCEVIFGAANLAHGSLPLMLVVIYALGWTIQREIPRFITVLVLNFLLIFTGFGLLMGCVTPVAILASLWVTARNRQRAAIHLAAASVALLSLALFFVHYTWNPAVACYDSALVSRTAGDYLHFAALICANYLGFDALSSRHPAVWGALLLAFLIGIFAAVAVAIWRSRKTLTEPGALPVVAFTLLAFSLAFCGATARGRLCLGFAAAQESRYMPYLTPGLLGAYFYLCGAPRRNWLGHTVLATFVAVCCYAGWPIHLGDQVEMSGFHASKLRWKECYLVNKDAAFCTRETRVRICNPPEAPYLQEKLRFLEKERLNLFDGR